MNREILFRGKRTDNGQWAEGYLSSSKTIGAISSVGNYDEYIIDPSTVCEYTGLTDKNGVKIFEGDIMRFNAYGLCRAGTVEYQDAAFCILCQKPDAFPFLDDAIKRHEAESIGNIFDNPELLEEDNT